MRESCENVLHAFLSLPTCPVGTSMHNSTLMEILSNEETEDSVDAIFELVKARYLEVDKENSRVILLSKGYEYVHNHREVNKKN